MEGLWSLFTECYYGSLILLQNSDVWKHLPLPQFVEEVNINQRRFRLLDKIGEGGYAIVYAAQQVAGSPITEDESHARFAIKRIFASCGEQLEGARREVEVMRALHHPNVLPLLDSCVCDSQTSGEVALRRFTASGPFDSGGDSEPEHAAPNANVHMVFPLYGDGTLAEECQRLAASSTSMATADVLQLLLHLCRGLRHIHQQGFSHRDVKPHNVLVQCPRTRESSSSRHGGAAATSGGADAELDLEAGASASGADSATALISADLGYNAVIMDFGSAGAASLRISSRAEALAVQEAAEAQCTATYRAPELFDVPSSGAIDYRKADVWSLGCTLYHIMYGASPFQVAVDQSGASLPLAVLNCSVPWPKDQKAQYPPQLHDLVMFCLAVDPRRRPTVEEVIERLQSVMHSN